jgi:hypothetical protein
VARQPAGLLYSIRENATVSFTAVAGENIVQCFLANAPGNASGGTVSSNNGLATIPLTAGITLTAPAAITVQCAGSGQTTGENISAIAVSTLN